MVREAIFNILGPEVVDRPVYDLFAGTGALGLEALSRGAGRAVFVESNRAAIEALKQNIGHLRYEDRAQVVALDVHRWVRYLDARERGEPPALVFIDPPYREFANHPERMMRLLRELGRRLPSESLIVLESGSEFDRSWWPEAASVDRRRYGSTHVSILTVAASPIEGEAEPGGGSGGSAAEPQRAGVEEHGRRGDSGILGREAGMDGVNGGLGEPGGRP
jgi:16S rRNA (guanine(966)-N(2))-methyltransferase RsmD